MCRSTVVLKTNGCLSLDAATKLLQYNLNPDYFNINVSNQLSPVFELKGIQASNGLSVDKITNLYKIIKIYTESKSVLDKPT